jgi:hypothetical protein
MRMVGFAFFRSFGQLPVAPLTAALLSEVGSDGFHGRLSFENDFSSLCLIVAAASEAISHTYTTCFSECCYHVVYGVCMDLLSHAPLG